MGIPSLTVTNVPGSTPFTWSQPYHVPSCRVLKLPWHPLKAYTAQIAVLAFLAKAVRRSKWKYLKRKAFDLVHELSIVAQSIESTLSEKGNHWSQGSWASWNNSRNAFYIGRGQDYYVAMEASLKLKEISYIQCEGFAAGELKHGTIALIEEGTPVLALLSDPVLANHTRGNIQEVAARSARFSL